MLLIIYKSYNLYLFPMLDRLVDLNSRQIQLKKSKIYKEILDNQVLQNKHYQQLKEANNRKYSFQNPQIIKRDLFRPSKQIYRPQLNTINTSSDHKTNKRTVDYDRHKNLDSQGMSRFIDVSEQKYTKRIRYEENQEDNESMDNILLQVKQLVQKCQHLKKSKKERLVQSRYSGKKGQNFPILERNHKNRQRKIDNSNLNYKLYSFKQNQKTIKSNFKLLYNPSNKSFQFIQPSFCQQLELDENYENPIIHHPQLKYEKRNIYIQRFKTESNEVPKYKKQSKTIDKQLQKRRENFINILKKVKNRGQSLYMKLVNNP